MGGISNTETKLSIDNFNTGNTTKEEVGISGFTYGASVKIEKKLGQSNFYLGMYADYITTEKLVGEYTYKSFSDALTLGYNYTKNFSTNIYLGGSANKINDKMDWEFGPLVGVSMDYTTGHFTHGLMLRYTQFEPSKKCR